MPECPCKKKSSNDTENVGEEKQVTFGDFSKEAMGDAGRDEQPYLPLPNDHIPVSEGKGEATPHMGPIGPWATGRVDWGPLAGLTGTRPVVDHYSITRFSMPEWRKKNLDVLCSVGEDQYRANLVNLRSRQTLQSIATSQDKNQHNNTVRLGERSHEIYRWKYELETAIKDMVLELDLLESQRRRAKLAKSILGIVTSINSECLSRRSMRMDMDLVRDPVEEELIKEAALVKEINDLLDRTLVQIEEQLERNKAIKSRMEDDWSDKKESYEIDSSGISLSNKSTLIMFKPGATRVPESQSTPQGWEDNCKDALQTAETVKAQSCELRTMLNGPILSDAVRDLRSQADKVDDAFARRIAETDLCRQAMEKELQLVIRKMAETENLIIELKAAMRGSDYTLKVAQTRLDIRHKRQRAENCRDNVQYGLIDEVKSIAENASTLKGQLAQAEQALVGLRTARGDLERDIQTKLKTLYIDNQRCRDVRSLYPSVTAMAGH